MKTGFRNLMNFTSPSNVSLAGRTVLKLYVVLNLDLIFN